MADFLPDRYRPVADKGGQHLLPVHGLPSALQADPNKQSTSRLHPCKLHHRVRCCEGTGWRTETLQERQVSELDPSYDPEA